MLDANERITLDVALGAVVGIVRESIDLDRKLRLGAVKVEDVWPQRMLFSKLDAEWLAFQFAPQQAFG